MSREKLVGQPVRRKEDERMIRGQATYVDDIDLPNLHHVAILRSPFAHAKINSIDPSAALAFEGVIDVITGEDTFDVGSVPRSTVLPESVHSPRCPVLAEGIARFVGEPVCAVVATSKEAARDALELIEVDYDPLPVASDPIAALEPGAPQLHDTVPGNQAFEHIMGGGSLTWDEARAQADHVIEQELVHQRLIPMAMEPRGVVASWDRGKGTLILRTSTQIPHFVRTFVALMLGLPETHLRIIAPDVGGGFGSKLNVYREEALLGFIARRTGKNVKWIEGRAENFQATIHGRGQTGVLRVACKSDGDVLGLEYEVVADLGAYHQLLTPAMPAITGLMLSGAYSIPHITIRVRGAFTNRMSTDAYRGAGRPEATMVIERAVDLVAHELGLDPVDVRRTNFPTAFPFTTATGLTYDSGDYVKALDRALEMADYAALRTQQNEARSLDRIVGVGISSYVEICALGPSSAMPSGGFGWESCTVRAHPTGSVTVMTGASPHGQGQETSFAQIAADMFGIGLDDVNIVHGDTAIVPYGVGTFGSRATAVGGTAMVRAIEKLLVQATAFASALLECEPHQVTFEDGVFKGPNGEVQWGEVAFAAHTAVKLPGQTEPGLNATFVYEPENFCYPFGTHICLVEIDRETGKLEILRYVAVDDCGNVINPLLVDGQIHGGIAQGLGQAMMEHAVYDEDGNLVTGSLMDYAIPRAHDFPRFETDRTETPTPVNPLGVKGVGEAGTIGSTPALVNAVVDALSPFGIRHVDMPLTPHRIWSALESARVLQGGSA